MRTEFQVGDYVRSHYAEEGVGLIVETKFKRNLSDEWVFLIAWENGKVDSMHHIWLTKITKLEQALL